MIKEKQTPGERWTVMEPDTADPAGVDASEIDTLLRRARDGDDDAFGEIVSLYERFVFNTACRILSSGTGSVSDAEDVAQAAFIKAWRSLSSFRGDCSFSTWIFRITVNCAKDAQRTANRHRTVSLTQPDEDGDEAEWDLPETSPELLPEENLERREKAEGIRRAIAELPEEQRQVLVLRDLHELPYSQISELLSLELGTVKSRLNRARQNLKNILKNGNFL